MANPQNLTEVKQLILDLIELLPQYSTIATLIHEYTQITGGPIPYRQCGYFSLEDFFLWGMWDTVQIERPAPDYKTGVFLRKICRRRKFLATNVPLYIRRNLEWLLDAYSETGIPCSQLLEAYFHQYNRHLHHDWIGFKSVLALCLSLPHIVQCIPNGTDYHLFAANPRVGNQEEQPSEKITSETSNAPDENQYIWKNSLSYATDDLEKKETWKAEKALEEMGVSPFWSKTTRLPSRDLEVPAHFTHREPADNFRQNYISYATDDLEEEEKAWEEVRVSQFRAKATTLPPRNSEVPANFIRPDPADSGDSSNPCAILDAAFADCVRNLNNLLNTAE